MKRELKLLLLTLGTVILIGLGIYLVASDTVKYAIILFAFAIALLIFLFNYVISSGNPSNVYEARIRSILNTYDSILVQSSNIPKLEGKDIILVDNIEDMVDAQAETRKPICFFKQVESCSFILIDNNQAFVHEEKLNNSVITPIEIEIKNIKAKQKNTADLDAEMLKEIEKTTIVRLSNMKSYKVSPVRKEKKEEKKEDTEDKKEKVEEEKVRKVLKNEVKDEIEDKKVSDDSSKKVEE